MLQLSCWTHADVVDLYTFRINVDIHVRHKSKVTFAVKCPGMLPYMFSVYTLMNLEAIFLVT
jgi:hypothetical protein